MGNNQFKGECRILPTIPSNRAIQNTISNVKTATMKKVIFGLLVCMACTLNAQESYWTNYQVVVEPQNVDAFYKLTNDYFTAHKMEGVTVTLYENHFNDPGNNFTHVIGFSGSLDALGNMYANDGGDTWELYLVKLNQQIKAGFSARMGTRKAHTGDLSQDYPIQKYFIVHAEDGGAWDQAYTKYSNANIPAGMLNMVGNITAGVSSDGENRWVINGFKDFKSAMGGASILRSDAQNSTNDKAWKTFLESNGKSHLVRSGLRVLMGKW